MIKDQLMQIVGADYVVADDQLAPWSRDWSGAYQYTPLAVVRPANTQQVSQILRLANETGTAVVPVSGNTGLAGGAEAEGSIQLSLDRMNRIREIRPKARLAIVEAGVILSALHDAADGHDLIFPLTFGARGSAMIGGNLATNAGGSNVLRYGNARDLCLGLEVVLPSGEVMDLMSELHKDNSGYNLKHLMIGAEGTLGIITAAVLKLAPKPRAYATAMVAVQDLPVALNLLNQLQTATGGLVEAFEYMPRDYLEEYAAQYPEKRPPFETDYEVNLLVEIATTIPSDSTPDSDGIVPLMADLETTLAKLFEQGAVLDAAVAQSEAQRREMWERREAAGEITMHRHPIVNSDIAVPLDRVPEFLHQMEELLPQLDAGAETIIVSHLGDGNVHYAVWPKSPNPAVHSAIMESVEDVTLSLGGSFSAEHGIGQTKLPSMLRRKNKPALGAMRAIKKALDPNNILNPGKVIPES